MAVVRVDGLGDLQRKLKRLGETDAVKAIKEANKQAAEVVAAEARRRAPVKTGRLRDSIRTAGQAKAGVVRLGKSQVPYAGFIDFGGTIRFKNRAGEINRPFLTNGRIIFPALDAKHDEVVQFYEREIDRICKEF